MKNIWCILILVAVDTVICVNQAYAGYNIGGSWLKVDTGENLHSAFEVTGGYCWNDYLCGESRMLMSPTVENGQEIDYQYGAYIMPAWPLDNSLSAYLAIGHTELKHTSDRRDSTSFGIGLSYDLREAYKARFECIKYSADGNGCGFKLSVNF